MKRIALVLLLSVSHLAVLSQEFIRGKVVESVTGLPIQGVHIQQKGSMTGVVTNTEGNFEIQIDAFPKKLSVSFIGYEPKEQLFTEPQKDERLIIQLNEVPINLEEISILSDQAVERYNPISFSTFQKEQIITTLGDKPLPEVLNFSPGIFASRDGGGSGDATLSVRGFQQENIAVLLNGIPINGAENGLVYWNNWMGLAEITNSIQIQRGIGASKVALNSVGGTINLNTQNAHPERGGTLNYTTTNYGNQKFSLSYHSGITEKGWAFSFLGSRTKGDGYVDGTYVDGWAYFFNVTKEISQRQRIVFTLLGGPERHGQRNLKLSKEEVDRYGSKYNKEWGVFQGEVRNSSENFYHKPHAALSHYLTLGKEGILATSVYFSPGKGGGKWNDNFGYEANLFSFRDNAGQIDWDAIYQYNVTNPDTFLLANGENVQGYSKIVQTNFLASHIWAGFISNFEIKITPGTKLISGVHYRYFSSDLKQEVADLLGGKFYLDDYSWSLAGVSGRNQIKMPGDVVRVQNGALMHQTTLFTQIEKKAGVFDLFAAVSISDNRFRRHDIYNYPANKWSEWVSKPGFDFKAGIGYPITDQQHIYANAAFFSKAPYYKFIFGNFNNNPVLNIRNEKVKTIEAGYQLQNERLNVRMSAYLTSWEDVSFLSNEYIQLENSSQTRAMVNGLNSLHKGIEFESNYNIFNDLTINGIASFGDWQWQNDVAATLFNDRDIAVDTVNVFAKGLKVGGQPQLQLGLSLEAKLMNFMLIKMELMHYEKHYAQFDPSGRQNENDNSQSYQLPSVTLLNLSYSIPISIVDQRLIFYGNINNMLDQQYILKGEDGINHDLESFRGFWGFGRTFDIGLRFEFN